MPPITAAVHEAGKFQATSGPSTFQAITATTGTFGTTATSGVDRVVVNGSAVAEMKFVTPANTYRFGFTTTGTERFYFKDGGAVERLVVTAAGADVTGILTATDIFAAAAGERGWTGRATMKSPSDGIITLYNDALSDFTRLQLGGTSSSFPSIKRSSGALHIRAADDSAFADLSAAVLVANNAVSAVSAGQIAYGATTQTTIGANGGASALTANPVGYVIINVAGTNRIIPYYTA